MTTRKDLTRAVGNPVPHSLKAKIKGKMILGMAVSTLFPQDQSALVSKIRSYETRVPYISQEHQEEQGTCYYVE